MSAAAALSIAAPWHAICALEIFCPRARRALVEGKEIAVFRVGDAVFAIGNHDPASDANVLSRGIVGDIGGEIVVARRFTSSTSVSSRDVSRRAAIRGPAYMAEVRSGRIGCARSPCCSVIKAQARLVVIGNGMAAVRAIEELRGLGASRLRHYRVRAEPHGSYIASLSPCCPAKSDRDIVTHPPEWTSSMGSLHREDPWPASIACAAACDPQRPSRHPSTGC